MGAWYASRRGGFWPEPRSVGRFRGVSAERVPGLEYRELHRSPALAIGLVHCRLPAKARGGEEATLGHSVVFPRSGTFVRETGRRRVVADVSKVLFFNGGEPYRVTHPLDGGDCCLVVAPRAADLLDVVTLRDPWARDRPDSPFAMDHARARSRAALFQGELLGAIRRGSSELSTVELALELVNAALPQAETQSSASDRSARTRRRHAELAEAVQVLIAERYWEPLTLPDIASEVGVTPFHLSRIFHDIVGLPVRRYLRGHRLRAALVRLAEGERDLTSLAVELGFSDHGHFANTFRAEFGRTPSEFRRTASGAQIRVALASSGAA